MFLKTRIDFSSTVYRLKPEKTKMEKLTLNKAKLGGLIERFKSTYWFVLGSRIIHPPTELVKRAGLLDEWHRMPPVDQRIVIVPPNAKEQN